MTPNRLSFNDIKKISSWWISKGGSKKVEIAALEPLLWKDNQYRIDDVVLLLKNMGFLVTMTTNASTLNNFASKLKNSGLDLLRISWHSLDKETYYSITGGGSLEKLLNGIYSAIESNLNIKINRVLLKGHTSDLHEQIDFVDKHHLKLKLLDLYWTPSIDENYKKYYISPTDALHPFMDLLTPYLREDNEITSTRTRVNYLTVKSGLGKVEYKVKESAKKENSLCKSCNFKDECLEGYADYFRVFPNGDASLCYLRGDLSTKNYENLFISNDIPLRFVLEGRCNFNCGFPGDNESWCLKQGRGFSFPKRENKIIRIQHKNED